MNDSFGIDNRNMTAISLPSIARVNKTSARPKSCRGFKRLITVFFLFISGLIIGLSFNGCVNWAHTVEHNQLRVLEENNFGDGNVTGTKFVWFPQNKKQGVKK